MEELNFKSQGEYEIKIFQIEKSHHKLNNIIGNHKIINYIINFHKEKIDDVVNPVKEVFPKILDGVSYYVYLYQETEKEAHWKQFLPEQLSENLGFKLKKISFVLFASIKDNIFAIVGGGGSRVITPFRNQRFGLELYEHLTQLDDEIVSITTRGISGTLTQDSRIFRNGQRISDTLDFTFIPSKMVLVLKDIIKDSVFDFIDFGNKTIYLEISSYFNIKHRITFKELHKLFIKTDEILKISDSKSLTSFIPIKEKSVDKEELIKQLFIELRDDMVNKYGQTRGVNPRKFDIDFIHPSNTKEFYECEHFEIKTRKAKKGIDCNDRSKLYETGLKYIFDTLGENVSQYDFNGMIMGLRVIGYKGKAIMFKAMFWQYVTCELNYKQQPVFHIDATWYYVKENFTNTINKFSSEMINKHHSKEDILYEKWDELIDSEDAYNSLYRDVKNYWVFDKALGQNIELCDIMYETENRIYFIHVKTGFDAKIRDLANQVLISAKRFMISRNSGKLDFLSEVVSSYNARKDNIGYEIKDEKEFLNKFKIGGKEIVFVMAFKSDTKSVPVIKGNLEKFKSNIAKFSLIQCIREMNTFSYPLEVIEIKNH